MMEESTTDSIPVDTRATEMGDSDVGKEKQTDSDEEVVPSLLPYISAWRFWYQFLRWPLLLLLFNTVVIAFMITFTDTLIIPIESMCLVLSVFNALLLRRAVYHVEKELQEEEEPVDSKSSFWDPTQVYAKVSNMVDRFLSRGQSTQKINFVVNLSYTLFVLMVVASATSLTCLIVEYSREHSLTITNKHEPLNLTRTDDDQAVPKATSNSELPADLTGVPTDVQVWARLGPGWEEPVSVIHLTSGWTFFSGHGRRRTKHLFSTSPTGDLQTYPGIVNPDQFQRFGPSENESANDDFCCLYDSDEWQRPRPLASVFCWYHGSFYNYSWPALSHGNSRYGHIAMLPHNNSVWLRFHYFKSDAQLEVGLEKLDIATRNATSIIVKVHDEDEFIHQRSRRPAPLPWIIFLVGSTVAIASSAWLFKSKELPCCTVPLVALIEVVAASVSEEWMLAISILGPIYLTVVLLMNPRLARNYTQMMVWSLYTLLLGGGIVGFINLFTRGSDDILGIAGLTTCIGIVLNHPILQLAAWVGAIISVLATLMGLCYADTTEVLLVYFVPVSVVVSCGLAALGHHVDKYRVHVAVYSRRLWRAMEEE